MLYFIDETSKRVMDDLCARVQGMRGGPGILLQNNPSGITIALAAAPPPPPTPRADGFWAKVTGNAAFGDNQNRYLYAWTQQRETEDGWEDMTGGLSGTTDDGYALNSIEANNTDADGTQGNSIDTATGDTTLTPVQGSPVVWMRAGVCVDDDGNPRTTYRFSYENAVSC